MDRFSKLHPIFHFLYFIGMFALIVSVYNPFFILVSLLGALLYEVKSRGKEALSSLKFSVVMILVIGLFNMLFAHYGMTVLFKIGDTEFTLEALFYGLNQGFVVTAMVLWFGIFGRVVDSEKVIYAFRFAPKTALLFSMVLGFIPRFTKKLKDIETASMALNGGKKPKNKMKSALNNLSALVTYSLESSIVTADSMTARGYNPKAVRYSRYKFKAIDGVMIALSLVALVYVICAKASGKITFIFDPRIYSKSFDAVVFVLFLLLSLLPVIIDLTEEFLWKISYAKN